MSSIYQKLSGMPGDINKLLKTKRKSRSICKILELSGTDFKISTVDKLNKVGDKMENFKRTIIFVK